MLASPSLNHLIRPRQQRGRDREADGLGGLEVDDQLECGGLPDGKITGLRAFEDAVNVAGSLRWRSISSWMRSKYSARFGLAHSSAASSCSFAISVKRAGNCSGSSNPT